MSAPVRRSLLASCVARLILKVLACPERIRANYASKPCNQRPERHAASCRDGQGRQGLAGEAEAQPAGGRFRLLRRRRRAGGAARCQGRYRRNGCWVWATARMLLPWRRRPRSCPPVSIGWARCRISAAARTRALAWLMGGYGFDRYKKKTDEGRAAGGAGRRGWRRDFAHRRKSVPGARPDQHPRQRHGAGRAGSRGTGAGQKTRRQNRGDQRRGAGEKLSPDRGGGRRARRARPG